MLLAVGTAMAAAAFALHPTALHTTSLYTQGARSSSSNIGLHFNDGAITTRSSNTAFVHSLRDVTETPRRGVPLMKNPWYFPEKEKDTGDDKYWKPGDDASLGGIFDAFMQGFQFNDKLIEQREAENMAAEEDQLAAWEEVVADAESDGEQPSVADDEVEQS